MIRCQFKKESGRYMVHGHNILVVIKHADGLFIVKSNFKNGIKFGYEEVYNKLLYDELINKQYYKMVPEDYMTINKIAQNYP